MIKFKQFKKVTAMVMATMMMMGTLAACGGASDETADTSESNSSNEAADTSAGGGTADTLTIGVDSDWNDISPFGTMSTTRTAVKSNFYEYLAVRKEFGAELEDMELQCAKDIEKVDEYTYRITMYDYITDSEGNEINAEDYAWAAMEMKAEGNYEKLNSYLDSVTAIDDDTVEIVLIDNALGTIEYVLNIVPVLSRAAYEASEDNMSTKPVATGVYYVDELVPGATLTLVKNENYWQTDESLRCSISKQNVDKIIFKVVTEPIQMSTALQTGEVDLAQYMDTTAIENFYKDGQALNGYQVEELSSNMMFSLLPNMSEESVVSQSTELREAIYHAIDAQSCIIAACGGYGSALGATANPLSSDYNEAWVAQGYYDYDADEAKAKLEESGVDLSGVTLKILTQPAMNLDKVAEVIQAQLLEVGINSEIISVEDALYQTYKLDPTQFDLILDIKGTDDFVTFPWSLLFDNRSFDGETANFIADDVLQEKLETAMSPETHSGETVNEFEEYLRENAYSYGLYTKSLYIVAVEGKISSFDYLQGSYILPGSCEY